MNKSSTFVANFSASNNASLTISPLRITTAPSRSATRRRYIIAALPKRNWATMPAPGPIVAPTSKASIAIVKALALGSEEALQQRRQSGKHAKPNASDHALVC